MNHMGHREEVFLPLITVYDHWCNVFDDAYYVVLYSQFDRHGPQYIGQSRRESKRPLDSHNAVEQIYGL